MTVLKNIQNEENSYSVVLDKAGKPSFGICIVRGEAKDSSSTKVSGIFIKDIVPNSPAALSGKLKVGDRILSLNDNDVRNASELEVIGLIRVAGQKVTLQIQSVDVPFESVHKNEYSNNSGPTNTANPTTPNGFMSNGAQNDADNDNKGPTTGSPEASDDDDEDTRDMTGRTLSAAGYEIDRASAGNVKKLSGDTEEPDEFGYTYGNMGAVHRTEVIRPPNVDLGLAIAGHRDRNKMACMVAGVNPTGICGKADLKSTDEILEVNGNVLIDRCHLNASVVFRNIQCEKIVFIVLRRNNNFCLAVKPVTKFREYVDETEYLFTAYENVRKIQIQKAGPSIGIMIIEGKHAKVGSGIFISDIQEDSNAMIAGLQVGELILAINRDVVVDHSYDEAADLLKRSRGLVTLIVCNLKTEEQLAAEAEEKRKAEEKKNAPPPEPEKPQDPSTAEIKTNQKTIIEIKAEKKPLGVVVCGGKNGLTTTGVVVTHIFDDCVIAKDNRLRQFDHIIEFNGNPLKTAEMTVHKCHQIFYLEHEKVTMMVWRNDPPETETVKVEFTRKSGKDIGLAMAAGPKGAVITEIQPGGCIDVNQVQRGDVINKINNDSLEGASLPECFALFKTATGKVCLEILRPKPTCRN